MLDEAHHNIMATASGGYRPLVQVLTDAEFDVTPNRLPFTPDRLAATEVVIVANPNGADDRAPVDARAASAFSDAEIDAVEGWVRGGGGLLLVTDHYPTGVAARSLANRFGVTLSGGWTDDPANRRTLPGYGPVFGYLVFSLENGLLPDHPTVLTTDWTYLRFHGPHALERPYHGAYTGRRLRSAARRIDGWLADGLDVYAYFNNDVAAAAVGDARWLRDHLSTR